MTKLNKPPSSVQRANKMNLLNIILRGLLYLLPIVFLPNYIKTLRVRGIVSWIAYSEKVPKHKIVLVRQSLHTFEVYCENKPTGYYYRLDQNQITI